MGKLIVFEGVDGSGKSTQYKLLCERMEKLGVQFRRLVFPRYSEPSSALLRMYLAGEFGDKPGDVNAYAASTFFAVDRYASFVQDWREYYQAGGLIVTDRYTTSNAVHQASKLPKNEQEAFLQWLFDFEYGRLGLPAPDLVLFVDVDLETALRHLRKRETETDTHADIHERDNVYLGESIAAARMAAERYGWKRLNGSATVEEIADQAAMEAEKLWI